MGLRVYKNREDLQFLEISSRHFRTSFRWMVPFIIKDSPEGNALKEDDYPLVRFKDNEYVVLFDLIETIPVADTTEFLGEIGYDESINVLNHIHDKLPYPPDDPPPTRR